MKELKYVFRYLFFDVKVIIAIAIFALTVGYNYYSNIAVQQFPFPLGAVNTMLLSSLFLENALIFTFPFVAVLPSSRLLFDELRSGYGKLIIVRSGTARYIYTRLVSMVGVSVLVTFMCYFIMLLLSLVISPYPSYRLYWLEQNRPFSTIYNKSMLAYSAISIINACIYAGSYTLLSSGVFLCTNNNYAGYVIAPMFYILSSFLVGGQVGSISFLPDSSVSIYLCPSEWQLILDHIKVYIMGFVLCGIGFFRWKRAATF